MRKTLIQDTLRLLEQGIDLLDGLEDELYSKPEPIVSMSGIGSHIRHCIDYFDRFMGGVAEGRIDYDLRARDTLIESNRTHARNKLRSLQGACRSLLERDTGVLAIKQDSAEDDEGAPWADSSLERELQFLTSHTVHHFALIGVSLRLNGIVPEEGFGVAPSTLRFWKENGLVHGDLDSRG
jgi:hypothetical protein